jgi:uncharacterized lipoprotein YddW (UPF0748 family)
MTKDPQICNPKPLLATSLTMRPRPLLALALVLLAGCQTTKDVTRGTLKVTGEAAESSWQTVNEFGEYVAFWRKPRPPVYAPEPPREFRAAWVATVTNIDWPSKPALPVARQIQEMEAILDRAVDLNLNAIILQVRPAADAIYASDLEPWSEYLTGEQGLPPAPYYDPLATWVTEAHRRGLELHAWFNPYRARHSGAKSPDAPNHVSQTMPDAVKKFNGWEWLDPADPRASQHTLDVITDVVRRYNIDGVHLDDYFYPYPEYLKGSDFPDEASWQRYQQSGGQLSRADWRRENVNRMIHDIHVGIKATKPKVKFGISPFGIARPGQPEIVETSFDQYEKLYADARLWLYQGWCDYFSPQLYWRLDSKQPFDKLLAWWTEQNPHNRHIWPGLSTSSANKSEAGWSPDEIVRQIETARATPGASGEVHFSMKALMENRAGVADALRSGPYATPALIPASPWLASIDRDQKGRISIKRPTAPDVQAVIQTDGSVMLSWNSTDLEPATWWGVWAREQGEWHFSVYPAQVKSVLITPRASQAKGPPPIDAVSVIAVDRVGNSNPTAPALELNPKPRSIFSLK